MCNACGRAAYSRRLSLFISPVLYSGLFVRLNELVINARLIYCYELFVRRFINIKNSLIVSIKNFLSTVSTPPITGPATVNFKEIIIIKSMEITS